MSDTEFRVRFGDDLTFKPLVMDFGPPIMLKERDRVIYDLMMDDYYFIEITEEMINAGVACMRGVNSIPTALRDATMDDKLPNTSCVIGECECGNNIKCNITLLVYAGRRHVIFADGRMNACIPNDIRTFGELDLFLSRYLKYGFIGRLLWAISGRAVHWASIVFTDGAMR